MIVALFVFAAIALCVLLILVALVSVASWHEERAWTLTERPQTAQPGLLRAGFSACALATPSGYSEPAAGTGAARSRSRPSCSGRLRTSGQSAPATGWRRSGPATRTRCRRTSAPTP